MFYFSNHSATKRGDQQGRHLRGHQGRCYSEMRTRGSFRPFRNSSPGSACGDCGGGECETGPFFLFIYRCWSMRTTTTTTTPGLRSATDGSPDGRPRRLLGQTGRPRRRCDPTPIRSDRSRTSRTCPWCASLGKKRKTLTLFTF